MNFDNLSSVHTPIVIDCFTFYNELSMLKFRLKELDSVIDKVVLVESRYTHAGNKKELFFENNKALFKEYLHKIIHIVVDKFPDTTDAWVRERYQRDYITEGLYKIKPNQLDLVIISDVDEIPDSKTILNLKNSKFNGVVALEQDIYCFNIETKMPQKWYHSKVCTYNKLVQIGGPEKIRFHASVAIQKGGWHLTYFGDTDFIVNKIKNFAHQEFNTIDNTNPESIKTRMLNNEDVFGNNKGDYVDVLTNTYIPTNWKMLV